MGHFPRKAVKSSLLNRKTAQPYFFGWWQGLAGLADLGWLRWGGVPLLLWPLNLSSEAWASSMVAGRSRNIQSWSHFECIPMSKSSHKAGPDLRIRKLALGVPTVAQQKGIQLVSMRMQVPSLASLSRLRIQCCYELWCRSQMQLRSPVAVAVAVASSCSSDSTPGLGTSICCRCSPKIVKKKSFTKMPAK